MRIHQTLIILYTITMLVVMITASMQTAKLKKYLIKTCEDVIKDIKK